MRQAELDGSFQRQDLYRAGFGETIRSVKTILMFVVVSLLSSVLR